MSFTSSSTYLVKLDAIAKDVLFPIISTGMVLYSNDRSHPFEVQYVAGWITSSIFHESNQRLLKFMLSSGLFLKYVQDFSTSIRSLRYAHMIDGTLQLKPNLTWMQSLNISGSLYLATTWLYMMIVQYKPEILRYRRRVSTAAGISYIVVTLALYRRFKRRI